MWTLSGFSDEISPDFEQQCSHIASLGMRYLEFRSAWDTNILDLTADQLQQAKQILERYSLRVSSIGSPIGKIYIDEPFARHAERAQHAVDVANFFGAKFIRIFSFFMREGMDPDSQREAVLARMQHLAAIASTGKVIMIHENEKHIYGDIPRRCADIITSVDSPNLRAAWDAANFVQVGVKPFDEGWSLIRPYLAYMQIKDAISGTGAVVTAGKGDGQMLQTIRALRNDGFDGFFSLEPHLGSAHALGGFSGPELFTEAHHDFTAMLEAEEIPFG